MGKPAIAMLLAGAVNLALAATWMFGALVGANGLDSARGGRFLTGMAVALVALWFASGALAWWLATWSLARGWGSGSSVIFASLLAMAAWGVMAFLATVLLVMAFVP